MPGTYVIALDTHCLFTEDGMLPPAGRWPSRGRCPTTIKDLRETTLNGSVPQRGVIVCVNSVSTNPRNERNTDETPP
ncbi:MAG: hypothetical protein HY287_10485 [Planctomycetes bacterium]|nr:hypothetical protein [Planctomycetota bacterium]